MREAELSIGTLNKAFDSPCLAMALLDPPYETKHEPRKEYVQRLQELIKNMGNSKYQYIIVRAPHEFYDYKIPGYKMLSENRVGTLFSRCTITLFETKTFSQKKNQDKSCNVSQNSKNSGKHKKD